MGHCGDLTQLMFVRFAKLGSESEDRGKLQFTFHITLSERGVRVHRARSNGEFTETS